MGEGGKKRGDPSNIPPRFSKAWWKKAGTACKLAAHDFMVDNGFHWGAAIAFYSLLSAFPLVLGIVSLAGYFIDPAWATERIVDRLGDAIPAGEADVEEIILTALKAGGGAGIISIVFLLWSGSYVFAAMTTALNMAYDVDEYYSWWKLILFRFAMLATVGVVLVLAIFARPILSLLLGGVSEEEGGMTWQIISAIMPPLLAVLAFFLVYRLVPRTRTAWAPALTGAILATLAFLLSRELFVTYLQHFGEEYDVIYGSLAIGIVLVFWAWIVAVILLFGGELASHFQALLVEGLTEEEVWEHHIGRSPDRQGERKG
jgi:membrane protein